MQDQEFPAPHVFWGTQT